MHILPTRLQPNPDLKQHLKAMAIANQIQAGLLLNVGQNTPSFYKRWGRGFCSADAGSAHSPS
jgi:hypothetical protein